MQAGARVVLVTDADRIDRFANVSMNQSTGIVGLAVLTVGTLLLVWSDIVSACSCARTPLVDHYRWADSVFIAEVLSVIEPTGDDLISRIRQGKRVEYKELKSYKGLAAYPLLKTQINGTSCGFHFVAGKRYLIFADIHGEVSLCSPTKALESDKIDFPLLRNYQETPRLSGPWQVFRSTGTCRLSVKVISSTYGPGQLSISAERGDKRYPNLRVFVVPPGPFGWSSIPTSVEVGRLRIALQANMYGFIDATEFLDKLQEDTQVTVGPLVPSSRQAAYLNLSDAETRSLKREIYAHAPIGNLTVARGDFAECIGNL